jgi:serine/threonine protein kinase
MTLLVLRELEACYKEQSEDAFDVACDDSLSGYLGQQSASTSTVETTAVNSATAKRAVVGTRPNEVDEGVSGNIASLRSAMGSWRPPSQKAKLPKPSSHAATLRQPPSTVTGVAPWAIKSKPISSSQPPLTITGVAPWAMNKSSESSSPAFLRTAKRPLPSKPLSGSHSPLQSDRSETAIAEEDEGSDDANETLEGLSSMESPALKRVHAYMEKLKSPDEDDKGGDGISSWAKAQMEESPVLLPNLKFHDLVFGQELGTGAFSTVKYARQIVKDRTRSKWPEFAVKIVSTQKIEELGYEQSINREIAILRVLSHPGISRLISSFRFRDGAYLVLEYASGGDLHTLLRKNGSLDHESTKFIVGSVAAALFSIHDRGFVYADCKPENILIMESGHIKLTDFGGCRPVTESAKALVKESSKNLIRQLRDGDWKPASGKPLRDIDSTLNSTGEYEDPRIEGTTAYLPPEVVLGAFPSAAADVWALGCVMFQCLSGRPPILEDTDELTAQKIVSFHLTVQQDFFGEDESSSTFNHEEKSLIKQMLCRDIINRPGISEVASDDYFEGMDIFRLHAKPSHQLDIGTVAPVSDAKWSRRQFSSIWAPQPQKYDINLPVSSATNVGSHQNEPILEGNEDCVLFFSTQKAPLLGKIREC